MMLSLLKIRYTKNEHENIRFLNDSETTEVSYRGIYEKPASKHRRAESHRLPDL